ncbi:pyridoxamine 5'-phosphate oxidase family protein [Hutsoniella sourekii]
MNVETIMEILQNEMKVAVFATVDQEGKPHARHAHVGVANEQGVFFMTSPTTKFYQQLMANPQVAITAMKEEEYLIQVIRLEGEVRPVSKDMLAELLANNPYVHQVYPDDGMHNTMQVFQMYKGEGFYHSLTQGHKYTFEIEG